MAAYNSQSIDIDLEEMFKNLSDSDQEDFLIDMFADLTEESKRNVMSENMWYLCDDTAIDIITETFDTMKPTSRETLSKGIIDAMTSEEIKTLVNYIKEH